MKPEHAITLMALALIVCLSGCGVTGMVNSKGSASITDQERHFAGALEFLRSGNEQRSKDLLEQVVAAAPVGGITDEALFRLALLQLSDESGGSGVQRAIMLLDQLKSAYPDSIWTYQSAPLAAYLIGSKTIREKQREMKMLKELNLSLKRDNRDLRLTIERLKILDLELEQKKQR